LCESFHCDFGYRVEVVEKTIPHTFIKKDLWGVDVLAVKSGEPLLAIQCSSGDHVTARIQKLKDAGFIELWKSVGACLQVWGWSKQGARGKKKTWQLRREAL
jgi:hypothetical protein